MNNHKAILLIEDNSSDVDLTIRALERGRIANQVVVARDGKEALDYLWGEGAHAGRDISESPAVTLLDLKLPRALGLEAPRRIRADARPRRLPVVILTSSKEKQDLAAGYGLGANSYIRKLVRFNRFAESIGQLRLYWLVWNEAPPRAAQPSSESSP